MAKQLLRFQLKKGVLQGDPASPLLFNLCFNPLMKLLDTPHYKNLGYVWGNGPLQRCNWMQYADDAAIIASSQKMHKVYQVYSTPGVRGQIWKFDWINVTVLV